MVLTPFVDSLTPSEYEKTHLYTQAIYLSCASRRNLKFRKSLHIVPANITSRKVLVKMLYFILSPLWTRGKGVALGGTLCTRILLGVLCEATRRIYETSKNPVFIVSKRG